MKRKFLVVLTIAASFSAYTQKPAAGINKRTGRTPSISDSLINLDIREKLVQLALQNPAVEIDDRNLAIAQYNLKRAKTNILNNITLSGNLNEYSIQPNTQVYGNLFPRYNIGALVPLGLFVTRGKDVKIARETIGINLAQKNDHLRSLREIVLTKYEDYLMDKELLRSQIQLYADVHTTYLTAEKEYADAKIKVDEYNRAYHDDNAENARVVVMQRNLNVTVLELERYIGVKLDDVLRNYK